VKRRRMSYAICALVMIWFGVVPGVSGAPLPQIGLPGEPITAANLDRLTELATLDYPDGDVWSVAFSPDGLLLATGSHDGAVRVWDVNRQELVLQFFGHDLDVYSVAFSPDGQLLASGGWDGSVRLWNVPTREKVADLRGHWEPVYSVAFSPDGRLLASGSGYQDNTVRLWDVSTLLPVAVLRNHYDWVTDVAFSPDGQFLLSTSGDGAIRRWAMPGGGLDTVLRQHTAPVGSVAFNSDGTLFASGSLDGTIRLWDAVSGDLLSTFDTDAVWQIAFSPDGTLIAAGAHDGAITFWDPLTGQRLAAVQAHPRWVNGLAFSPDGTLLATAGEEGVVKLWGVPRYQSDVDAETVKIEDIALRVHLHNARSTDLTIWPGGVLGTNTLIKPVVAPGESLKGLEFPGLGSDQAPVALDDLTRPTLIVIFASWCDPCVQEFPLLTQVALAPEDHAYDVIFVDSFEDEQAGLSFLSTQKSGIHVVSDPESKLAVAMGTIAIPISVLIDGHQNVIAIQMGKYTSVQAALFEILARDPGAYTGHFDPTGRPAPAHFVEIQPFEESEPLQYGQSVAGTITSENVQQVYAFEGYAGDVVSVRMDTEQALEPYVVLLTPEGDYLAESSDFLYETYAQVQNVTLPEDGVYHVVATRYMGADGVSAGDYTLTVTK
jgi:WD40 repeat protein/thiol-disulfide isomerase/thioredoxin